jgi:hexosaminidase
MIKLLRTKLYIPILLMFTLISCNPAQRVEKQGVILPIIPQPNEVCVYEGSFSIDAMTQLVFSSEEQKKASDWFINEFQKSYGWSCKIGTSSKRKNRIELSHDDSLVDEAYLLDINETRISIKASSEAGYFYAFQSILQLIPVSEEKTGLSSIEIAQMTINDQPRFKWRGLMLDISRHFFGPETIKGLIDQMAAQKLNRLHLHLSDDNGWRIEIKEYPKLTEIGGRGNWSDPMAPVSYLTEQEARDIAAYANKRQIVIVPEIDIPGHSGSIEKAYPEFSGGNNTLNIANDDAVKMIETVLLRVADLFNSNYVHFGSDEVRDHNWNGRADMQAKMKKLGLKNQHEMEGWFDRKMADFIISSGLKPVAWDEASDFGVNNNTIVQWWRCLQPEVLDSLGSRGYDIIISPADYIYLDYPYTLDEAGAIWEGLRNGGNSTELIYNWNPIPATFTDSMISNVLGIEAAIWTEFISKQEVLDYMVFPRLSAVAEKAWTNEKNMNWEGFKERLSSQYVRYEKAGINYRLPDISVEERKIKQPEAFEGQIPNDK